jgi:hypothetical protein
VIDTGIDINRPEFERRMVDPLSWVCPQGVQVPCSGFQYVDDHHGHGTHVAGTVAAADDGVGVTTHCSRTPRVAATHKDVHAALARSGSGARLPCTAAFR